MFSFISFLYSTTTTTTTSLSPSLFFLYINSCNTSLYISYSLSTSLLNDYDQALYVLYDYVFKYGCHNEKLLLQQKDRHITVYADVTTRFDFLCDTAFPDSKKLNWHWRCQRTIAKRACSSVFKRIKSLSSIQRDLSLFRPNGPSLPFFYCILLVWSVIDSGWRVSLPCPWLF